MAKHLYRCPLRWADMDAYGIVNNVIFLRLLEEARVDFIFRMAPVEGDAFFRDGSVVVRHEIDYKRRLVHRHAPVDIEMWVSDISVASMTVHYEVRDPGSLYARASTVVVPYNLAEARPRRITPEERAFLEKYRDEDGNAAG